MENNIRKETIKHIYDFLCEINNWQEMKSAWLATDSSNDLKALLNRFAREKYGIDVWETISVDAPKTQYLWEE